MLTSVVPLTVRELIADGGIRSLYQPIVELDTGRMVGVEALARGPEGSALESPGALFAAARRERLEHDLDWECRAVAIRGALEAGLPRSCRLFVNAEPMSFRTPRPAHLDEVIERGASELSIVVEVTERAITSDPSSLLDALKVLRALGFGVALDDVGAIPASLAIMPFIEPDVIKLDMSLIHHPLNAVTIAIAASVQADAERRGALILAEGIETEVHLERALALGAHLGQGWLFGRPEPLGTVPATDDDNPVRNASSTATPPTPWSLVSHSTRRRRAIKQMLMPMSHHIEDRALTSPDPSVLIGAFQSAVHFTPATVRRYARLGERCAFVGALGAAMPISPAPGVRGAALGPGHPLRGEWVVTMVGPYVASALIAREIGGDVPDRARVFDYVITHDRDLVIAATQALLQYITPTCLPLAGS